MNHHNLFSKRKNAPYNHHYRVRHKLCKHFILYLFPCRFSVTLLHATLASRALLRLTSSQRTRQKRNPRKRSATRDTPKAERQSFCRVAFTSTVQGGTSHTVRPVSAE